MNGFAGPGYIDIDEPLNTYSVNIMEKDDAGSLRMSGRFTRNDNSVLPASTALYLYFDDGDEETDFVRGQGEMNYNTGDFSATVTDIPPGYGTVILSFVVADPGDSPSEIVTTDTVFPVYVVNNGCSRSLTISLEWNTDNSDLDLSVVEPTGNSVYYGLKLGVSVALCVDGKYQISEQLHRGRPSAWLRVCTRVTNYTVVETAALALVRATQPKPHA